MLAGEKGIQFSDIAFIRLYQQSRGAAGNGFADGTQHHLIVSMVLGIGQCAHQRTHGITQQHTHRAAQNAHHHANQAAIDRRFAYGIAVGIFEFDFAVFGFGDDGHLLHAANIGLLQFAEHPIRGIGFVPRGQ